MKKLNKTSDKAKSDKGGGRGLGADEKNCTFVCAPNITHKTIAH